MFCLENSRWQTAVSSPDLINSKSMFVKLILPNHYSWDISFSSIFSNTSNPKVAHVIITCLIELSLL